MRSLGTLAIVSVVAWTGPGSAAEILTHVDVFTSGTEGYHTFRVPAIETAPDGSLIALAEARKYSMADPGFHGNDIDLVVRVSYDEGETFPVVRMIAEEPAAYSDLTVLEDKTAGVLWERGGYKHITFTRFNLEFLEPAGR